MYQALKQKLIKPYFKLKSELVSFNIGMNFRAEIKAEIKANNYSPLKKDQEKLAIDYYKSKNINLKHTLWHRFFTGKTGVFYENYLPADIFHSYIAPHFNRSQQWPALLDKNLSYSIFEGFKQPDTVLQNINGFFFDRGSLISESKALDQLKQVKEQVIIKPSLDSGGGKKIESFFVKDIDSKDQEDTNLKGLLKSYKKDFIIQKIVSQSETMKALNPTSLNTIRVLSFLKGDAVYILSALLRIGAHGSNTDNYCKGGTICGINMDGTLKSLAYKKDGSTFEVSPSGILLSNFAIPNYTLVEKFVKQLHLRVPYFRMISWDIGIDENDFPVFIEYNTYRQGVECHQIVNGPFLGQFEDEILSEVFD